MTDLQARLGLGLPIVQAPMAGHQDARLAVAVASTGALGSVPCATLTPDGMRDALRAFTAQSSAPVNVNFFCHQPPRADASRETRWRAALAGYYREFGLDPSRVPAGPAREAFGHDAADAVEPFRPAVVSFHFGLPSPALLARVRAWGACVMASATTADEAEWLVSRGADVVIAQGVEAGGHRGLFLTDDLRTQTGTLALVARLARAVPVPVIAAGGIADAPSVHAALRAGAAGVQAGTAYLLTPEATTTAVHRAALHSEAARETALTNLFTGRPARGIVNRLMRDLGPMSALPPDFPLAAAALAPLRAAAEAAGTGDFSPLWCGQHAAACRAAPAAEITRQLAAGL